MTISSSAKSPYAWCLAAVVVSIVIFQNRVEAQESARDTLLVPITAVFHDMGKHLLGSISCIYGLNYLFAGASTYGIVESGLDWKWYRFAQDHSSIPNAGFVPVGIGPLASVAVPLGLYLYGRSKEDENLQITGLALGQSAILAAVITSTLKAFTGRVPPDSPENLNDYSRHFRFGFLRGGIYEGWPSSHTATAFAVARTLMILYPDNSAIRYGGWAYATIIGLGVSTNIHWLSDAVAGGLIGYAIGESVGAGYRNLINRSDTNNAFSFLLTPKGIVLTYRF